MVDVVVTAANVARVSGSVRNADAGVAITAGDVLYIDSNGVAQLAQHDLTDVEAAAAGIALNDAAVGQPVTYQVAGVIDLGAVLTAGEVYVVGAGDGGIAPVADIGVGDYATVLGVAVSSNNLQIGINASGVAAA